MRREGMDRRDFMKGAVAAGAGFGALAGAGAMAQEASQETARVPRTKLGATGVEIPILLMGCYQKFDPQYDKRLHHAYRLGVDYLDTAETYADGQSHKTLAPFIKQIGDRKKLWITSKVMYEGGPDMSPKFFTSRLEGCLADLETDYLDLFFMHAVQDERLLDAEYRKMGDDLKKAGKARFFGFSCHHGNVPELLEKAAAVGGFDAIMFRYSFRQYGDVKLNKAMDAAKKAGIGLIAMKTQASVPEDQTEVKEFQSKDWTLAQAKLKAVWADDRIDAAVSTMSNMQQIQENTSAAISSKALAMSDFMQLHRYAARTAGHHCLGCNHICESRVDGPLRIADTLRYLMYHESYPVRDEARRLYGALRDNERAFRRVDLRAAMAACPQGIDIAKRLEEAERTLLA